MDTWLPRLMTVFVVSAVGLWLTNLAWLVGRGEKPPVWLFVTAFGVTFAGALLSHAYNAAHDSMPQD